MYFGEEEEEHTIREWNGEKQNKNVGKERDPASMRRRKEIRVKVAFCLFALTLNLPKLVPHPLAEFFMEE